MKNQKHKIDFVWKFILQNHYCDYSFFITCIVFLREAKFRTFTLRIGRLFTSTQGENWGRGLRCAVSSLHRLASWFISVRKPNIKYRKIRCKILTRVCGFDWFDRKLLIIIIIIPTATRRRLPIWKPKDRTITKPLCHSLHCSIPRLIPEATPTS